MEATSEPKIALQQIAVMQNAANGLWTIYWQVDNPGDDALIINSVKIPHGQFKSAIRYFTPALELTAGASERFESLVQCHEPVGPVTENAFVIFHCHWGGEAWRIFVRIRVEVQASGEPHATNQLITSQKVGFSGIAN